VRRPCCDSGSRSSSALRHHTRNASSLWKPTPMIGQQPVASHCYRCRSCARAYKPQEFVAQLVMENELASTRCQTSPPVAQSSVLHESGGSFGRNCIHLVAGRVLGHEFVTSKRVPGYNWSKHTWHQQQSSTFQFGALP
jgi:hypothetical protein